MTQLGGPLHDRFTAVIGGSASASAANSVMHFITPLEHAPESPEAIRQMSTTTAGVMPAMARPLLATAPTIEAIIVPWPCVSLADAFFVALISLPITGSRSQVSSFLAVHVLSIPVSMMP